VCADRARQTSPDPALRCARSEENSPVPSPRIALAITALLACAVGLSGCAADWNRPHAVAVLGSPGPGFSPSATPAPESTLNPRAGSWDDIRPAAGYRVVLLTAGSDRPAKRVAAAVRSWARDEDVDLRTVDADRDHVQGIVRAIDQKPDLVISAGNALVDALALVTASHLDQQFLIVGAEVAEPTTNVTAVDWTGASFRGEGLGMSSHYDPASFTSERCGRGVRAGVAAVLTELTGVVLWID
jgi:hypothetical protein